MLVRIRNLSPRTTIFALVRKLQRLNIEPADVRRGAEPHEIIVDVTQRDGLLLILSWDRLSLDGSVLQVMPGKPPTLESDKVPV